MSSELNLVDKKGGSHEKTRRESLLQKGPPQSKTPGCERPKHISESKRPVWLELGGETRVGRVRRQGLQDFIKTSEDCGIVLNEIGGHEGVSSGGGRVGLLMNNRSTGCMGRRGETRTLFRGCCSSPGGRWWWLGPGWG